MRSPKEDLQNAIDAFNAVCDESHPLCFQWSRILLTIKELEAQLAECGAQLEADRAVNVAQMRDRIELQSQLDEGMDIKEINDG
jgi:hypothetical protein